MKEWSRLKKVAAISAITIFGLAGIGGLTDQKTTTINSQSAKTVSQPTTPKVQSETTQTQTPAQTAPASSTPAQTTPVYKPTPEPSCPNGTYVNSDGFTVCSPYAASSAPAGATAQCVDGTYSFSLHHSGTCSHHGGVSTWL